MSDSVTSSIASPCAACKTLRKRCADNCVLAPYFPPNDPHKFLTAHRVFGASNIIKLLQDLPVERRADAVSSMVYEANARIRDPVYGSAGAICNLQQQLSKLQSQLATAQAELLHMRLQHANLLALFSKCNGAIGTVPAEISFSPPADSVVSRDNTHDFQQLKADDLILFSDQHDDGLMDLWDIL